MSECLRSYGQQRERCLQGAPLIIKRSEERKGKIATNIQQVSRISLRPLVEPPPPPFVLFSLLLPSYPALALALALLLLSGGEAWKRRSRSGDFHVVLTRPIYYIRAAQSEGGAATTQRPPRPPLAALITCPRSLAEPQCPPDPTHPLLGRRLARTSDRRE